MLTSEQIVLAIDGILDIEPVLCFSETFHFKLLYLVDFELGILLGNSPFSSEAE